MLVLTRKVNESIVIDCPDGTVFEFTIVRISGTRCTISFDAPDNVKIRRGELQERESDVH